MDKIQPTNISAQLNYRGRGNSPGTLLTSTIGNCFPGLEFDFRNALIKIFEGIELHEALNVVRSVDPERADLQGLTNAVLLSVTYQDQDGDSVEVPVRFNPALSPDAPDIFAIERSNAFVDLFQRVGETVTCKFQPRPHYFQHFQCITS